MHAYIHTYIHTHQKTRTSANIWTYLDISSKHLYMVKNKHRHHTKRRCTALGGRRVTGRTDLQRGSHNYVWGERHHSSTWWHADIMNTWRRRAEPSRFRLSRHELQTRCPCIQGVGSTGHQGTINLGLVQPSPISRCTATSAVTTKLHDPRIGLVATVTKYHVGWLESHARCAGWWAVAVGTAGNVCTARRGGTGT